jgi:predicted GNAT family acetyltransferase
MDDAQVVNNSGQHRFEIHHGDEVAFLKYAIDGQVIELIHTQVPKPLEGKGYGGRLAAAALGFAAQQSLVVTPTCPFVRGYIRRHPEYLPLLHPR